MKIVFVSCYFNHHQRPLSDALDQITGGNYCFIETTAMRDERRALGYGWDNLPAYVIRAHLSEFARQRSLEQIRDADVVITGSAPEGYLKDRIRAGKLIFRYAERPLKLGLEPLKYVPRLLRWNLRNPAWKPMYLLAASGYAAEDYAKFGMFRRKAYRWGYFPEAKHYAELPDKDTHAILWVGRFLNWKHPDDALEAAARLRDSGYRFHLTLIGTGPMEQQLRDRIAAEQLADCVTVIGPMGPEQVRSYMERAGILLCTSDRQEGWGAVVNEAMNSGCAVVASQAAGCVPYLIQDGVNGGVYPSGNVDALVSTLQQLLDHPQLQKQWGAAAYQTITGLWNAEIAAARLVALAEGLLGARPMPQFPDGPCSPEP